MFRCQRQRFRRCPLQPLNPLQSDQAREEACNALMAACSQMWCACPSLCIQWCMWSRCERSAGSARGHRFADFQQPGRGASGGIQSRTIGMGLGFDPALFVQHAVRDAQARGEWWSDLVEGRLGRLSLGGDGRIATRNGFEPSDAQIVPHMPGKRNLPPKLTNLPRHHHDPMLARSRSACLLLRQLHGGQLPALHRRFRSSCATLVVVRCLLQRVPFPMVLLLPGDYFLSRMPLPCTQKNILRARLRFHQIRLVTFSCLPCCWPPAAITPVSLTQDEIKDRVTADSKAIYADQEPGDRADHPSTKHRHVPSNTTWTTA